MGDFNDKELNFNDMDKVAGGKLDIVERDGKFRVIKEYENEFNSKEDAESWLYGKAEKCLDKECGKPRCHGPGCKHDHGGPGMPPPQKPN